MAFKLGDRLKDSVTGFEGVATAETKWLNGCVRYCLEAGKSEGGIDELWFDVQRLKKVGTAPRIERGKTGGARPAPAPRGSR